MATGEGRRGPPTLRLFPTLSLWPIPTLRRMPTTDTTAMVDGIIPTMDTPGPTTTDTTGAKIVVQLFNTKLSSFCKKREEIIFFPFEEKSASNSVSQQTKPATNDLFSSQSPQKPEGPLGE